MTEQKVYDLLELVEKKNGLYEEEVIRLLSFIYNDVYDCFDKEIANSDSWQFRDSCKDTRRDMGSFLDCEDDSILFYLYEMISDNKTEFIEKFFSVCNRYFKIVDNKFYDSNEFDPMTFTFNIYTFLKLYSENKEDFDYFSTMVDNFSFLIIGNKFFNNFYGANSLLFLTDKKEVLSLLISLNAFERVPVLKDFCSDFLEKIAGCVSSDTEVFDKYIDFLENLRVYIPIIDGLKKHPLYKEENVTKFIEEALEGCDLDLKVYFSPNYFLGNRFDSVLTYLDDSIDDNAISLDLYERISELSLPLFDYLNEEDNEKDSFIECLDIIFDSDTFYEIDSKLSSLSLACNKYDDGEIEESLRIVRSLNDPKHKKIILDKSVSYRDDLVNKADKPSLIIDREKECIVGVFGTFNGVIEKEIDDVYENTSGIDEFEKGITSLIEKNVERYSNNGQTTVVNSNNINAYNFDEVPAPQKRIGFFRRRN